MDNLNITTDRLKEETQHNSSFFKSIAMDGPGLVAIVAERDLKITFLNNTFEYYLGYNNGDLEGKGLLFTDLTEDYMKDRLLYQLSNIRDDVAARSRYVIYEIKGKTGQKFTCYLYASPISGDAGIKESSYHFILHPDLSKWDMPFSSFNSRELFLEQFTSEDFGTFEWLIEADKIFWSAGVYKIHDVDKNNHLISNLFAKEFVHPDDQSRLTEVMKNALLSGEDINVEYRIVTGKQKLKIIHSLARTMKNKSGHPVKLVGSIRDITSQRMIEEDLKKKVDELNHSNRELEEFAYVASHDMQEPLRKITTFSDRLSEKYKDLLQGDGAMYLSRMIVSAENMRALINDLLDFSRISKTAQPFEPVHLNVILRTVKTELELIIEETGTTIHSPSLPVIDAIPSQMKQLFVNLIGNAIKFHKENAAPVITIECDLLVQSEVKAHELLSDVTYYKIQISDNGIGFDNEYAQRIFQVFQRLHGKSDYPGSGIGLAICKKILEYHSGIIYAENIEGVGSRFTFILPQKQQPKQ